MSLTFTVTLAILVQLIANVEILWSTWLYLNGISVYAIQ
jgi:hypothetical protein